MDVDELIVLAKQRRNRLSVSATHIAELFQNAGHQVSGPAVTSWERGDRDPRLWQVEFYLAQVGVRIDPDYPVPPLTKWDDDRPDRFMRAARAKRKALGLTSSDLAKQLGVSKFAVNTWQKGTRVPDLPRVRSLYSALRMRIVPTITDDDLAAFLRVSRGETEALAELFGAARHLKATSAPDSPSRVAAEKLDQMIRDLSRRGVTYIEMDRHMGSRPGTAMRRAFRARQRARALEAGEPARS